jgi:hypothetical protein
MRPAVYWSISWSLPLRVVVSAAALLHVVGDDRRRHATSLVQQPHTAVVARHERPLGSGQRHVKLSLGVLAVDEQRSGEPDRDLGDADELLDVAGGDLRIERVVRNVLQIGAGLLLGELGPAGRRLTRVVVLLVARHRDPAARARGTHRSPLSTKTSTRRTYPDPAPPDHA